MVEIEKYDGGEIQGERIKTKNKSVGVDFLLALWCLAEFCPSDDWHTHTHTHTVLEWTNHMSTLCEIDWAEFLGCSTDLFLN